MARNERKGFLAAPGAMLHFPVQQPSAAKAGGAEACGPVCCLSVCDTAARAPAGARGCRGQRQGTHSHPAAGFQGEALSPHKVALSSGYLHLGLVWLCPPVWVLVTYFQTGGLTRPSKSWEFFQKQQGKALTTKTGREEFCRPRAWNHVSKFWLYDFIQKERNKIHPKQK